ncbi:MAG: hypothetical protein PHX38_02340 [Sulfuricella sp.]|nr:hypothetical protein [Sulfuricella sp.]
MIAECENLIINRPILSVHTPKTAGTTLLHLLKRTVGSAAVLVDNADDPCNPASPRNLDPEGYFSNPVTPPPEFMVVHGHFHIHKYSALHPAFRMTFLRDPVDTMLSIHTFWQTFGYGHNALHDYFLKNKLNVLEMARLPILRHMLSHHYFGNVNMRMFDFIGCFETFSKDMEVLSLKLGIPIVADVHLNRINKEKQSDESECNAKTRTMLRDILIDDSRFYENTVSRG